MMETPVMDGGGRIRYLNPSDGSDQGFFPNQHPVGPDFLDNVMGQLGVDRFAGDPDRIAHSLWGAGAMPDDADPIDAQEGGAAIFGVIRFATDIVEGIAHQD